MAIPEKSMPEQISSEYTRFDAPIFSILENSIIAKNAARKKRPFSAFRPYPPFLILAFGFF
jgi:hypothetical protein